METDQMSAQTIWIGSYSSPENEGLFRCCFNPVTGFAAGPAYHGLLNPSYLLEHPVHPVLYTVEETDEGAVCAWREENGGFAAREELMEISGIGEIDEKLEGYQADGTYKNAWDQIKTYLDKNTEGFQEEYLDHIPWLDKHYNDYIKQLQTDPYAPNPARDAIMSLKP